MTPTEQARADAAADVMTARWLVGHSPFELCPVSGLPIPADYIWTDHARPGSYNACAACSDQIPKTLRQLNAERGRRRRAIPGLRGDR
jgi:hypothetical protein